MKIVKLFSVLVLSLFILGNYSYAANADMNGSAQIKNEVVTNSQSDLHQNVVIDFTLDYTSKNLESASCKVSGSVTVTTESGNSVNVTFTITADTCKEAFKAYNEFMAAWASSQQ
jgi:hypothetical protein